MSKNQFYLRIGRDDVGSNAGFHGKSGSAYTTNIDEADIYTLEEAQKEVKHLRQDCNELPLSVCHVDNLSRWRVDMQCIFPSNKYPNVIDKNNEYVAIKEGFYDGNDLGFYTGVGFSYNYDKAMSFSEVSAKLDDYQGYYFIAKTLTDEVARRTFPWSEINRRKMIQGAGIIGVIKPRERRSSGKTRWNCPCCGKLSWQYNPYDFDGCIDINCDAHELNNLYLYR